MALKLDDMTVRVRPKHSPEIDGIVLSSTFVIILKARKGITYVDGTRGQSERRRIGLFIWIGVMLGLGASTIYDVFTIVSSLTESEMNILLL